jgi:hypothetical protein
MRNKSNEFNGSSLQGCSFRYRNLLISVFSTPAGARK